MTGFTLALMKSSVAECYKYLGWWTQTFDKKNDKWTKFGFAKIYNEEGELDQHLEVFVHVNQFNEKHSMPTPGQGTPVIIWFHYDVKKTEEHRSGRQCYTADKARIGKMSEIESFQYLIAKAKFDAAMEKGTIMKAPKKPEGYIENFNLEEVTFLGVMKAC